MTRVIVAELRDSWSAWLGVCLGFIMTGFGLTPGIAGATPRQRLTAATLDVPVLPFAVALEVTSTITVAATSVPTLRSLSLAEPKVISRLISE